MKKVRVSTYARMNKKSNQWAYNEIEKGKVKSEKIDGVTFIIIEND